ncbi:hypothetical protein [Pseudomonas sp. PB103]|nr:hypothetical protein [Pseudomonas sp. PB103]
MQTEKTTEENLNRVTSGPENFGWAPLAWAHISKEQHRFFFQ